MEANETISEHGLFWVQNHDEKKLWGTLRINEINEATLETFGSLIDSAQEHTRTIVGLVKGGQTPVTLLKCLPTRTQHALGSLEDEPDWSHQTYRIHIVLEGIGLEGDEEPTFSEAVVNISTLPKWVNPNLVNVKFTRSPSGRPERELSIHEREDETLVKTFEGTDIKIAIRFIPTEGTDRRSRITKYSLEDDCFLVLQRADGGKLLLETITAVISRIQDLLTICCNEEAFLTSLYLEYEQDDWQHIKVFLRMKGYKSQQHRDEPFPALDFENIGQMEGIARWLEITEKYHPAAAVLTSHWYFDTAYIPDKLSRVYTALEGLNARKRNKTHAIISGKELGQFVDQAIPDFQKITNSSAEDWADKVKAVRDKAIAHLDPTDAPPADGPAFFRMANILYVAGACFLLREIGIEEPEIRTYIDRCRQSGLLRYNE